MSRTFEVFMIDSSGEFHRTSRSIASILNDSKEIHARDLLALNPGARRRPAPSILPRGEAIIMALCHMKAIIHYDRCMVFDAERPNVEIDTKVLAAALRRHSQEAKEQDGGGGGGGGGTSEGGNNDVLPYELVVVETLLNIVTSKYEQREMLLRPVVDSQLRGLIDEDYSSSIDIDKLHRLVPLKDGLLNFQSATREVAKELKLLLANDEDMLGLLLTERRRLLDEGKDPAVAMEVQRHDQVELLLEAYLRQVLATEADLSELIAAVRSREELAELALDHVRNRMLRLNAQLSMGAVALGLSTTVAGIFGMNLVHGFEQGYPSAFYAVSGGSLLLAGLFFGGAYHAVWGHRVREVSSRGELAALRNLMANLDAVQHVIVQSHSDADEISRDDFRTRLTAAMGTQGATEEEERAALDNEIKIIYDVFDSSRDGAICRSELQQAVERHAKRKPPPLGGSNHQSSFVGSSGER